MLAERRREMTNPYSTEKLVYSLYNHTCNGTEATVINTGLRIYNTTDFPYGYKIEFEGTITRIDSATDLGSWFACMDESGSPWPGIVLRQLGTSYSLVQIATNSNNEKKEANICTANTIGNKVAVTVTYNNPTTTMKGTYLGQTVTNTCAGKATLNNTLLIGATWNSTATGYMRYGYVQIDSFKVYKLLPKKSNITYGNFGGYMFSPGPLVYENSQFRIQNTWNEVNSYGSKYGLTNGSTYFRVTQLPTVNLTFDVFTDWKVPTHNVLKVLMGTISGYTRPGSNINGNTGKHYCRVSTNITFHNTTNIWGYIFFPDNKTITGKTISYFDTTTATGGFTDSDINNYIKQGCIFLPVCGYYRNDWAEGDTLAGSQTSTYADGGCYYTLLLYDSSYNVDATLYEYYFHYPSLMYRTI